MVRQGAITDTLEVWHADIFDFIDLRKRQGEERRRAQDLFLAVSIPSIFIDRIKKNGVWTLFDPYDVPGLTETFGEEFNKLYEKYEDEFINKKRDFNPYTRQMPIQEIVNKLIYSWTTEGLPFWFFKDNANKAHKYHKELGIVRSSNLCVTADTYILTQEYGNIPIGLLVDSGITEATCWNGEEWSLTKLAKTSEDAELMEVKLNNFTSIKATPEHKWYVVNDNYNGYKEVRTHEMKPGDKLIRFKLPSVVVSGQEILPNAYTSGLFAADGCETGYGCGVLYLYNEKIALLPYLTGFSSIGQITTTNENNNIRQSVYFRNSSLLPKTFVPNSVFRLQDRLSWLAGLIDGDGTLTSNQNAQSIQLSSTNLDFLKNIRLMLQELGVDAKIQQYMHAGPRLLPTNKGDGSKQEYYCNDGYRLLISGAGLNRLLELGYKGYRVMPMHHNYNRVATEFVKVVSVTPLLWKSATYCGNEPKRHMLMFNGVLTGNCQELIQPVNTHETAVCNLGSLNISTLENENDIIETSQVAVRFLDNVIDVTDYSTEKAKRTQLARRSIGIGYLGEAEYLAVNHIHYGSKEHEEWLHKFYSLSTSAINNYSVDLAKEKGGCDVDPSIRNAYRMCIAPNTASGLLAGTTPSHEPLYARVYTENSKIGSYKITAPHISIDNIEYYKNAFEIPHMDQIRMLAARQQYIDMAISNSLYEEDVSKISAMDILKVIVKAHDLGVKTLYYFRTKAKKTKEIENVIQAKAIVCEGCEN